MYEHKRQRLAPKPVFYRRLLYNFLVGCFILLISLVIGVVGYHYTAPAGWLDSFHNASMILSGMGPVITDIQRPWGKVFSALYALFSGIVFIGTIGIILAPAIHRFFHRLHMEEK